MRGLAADGARFGIVANSIALGTMEPPLSPAKTAAWAASDRGKAVLARYPIRRRGQAHDVTGLALLLASDASSWITGQTYPVNGGYSPAL
jgi:3-oxoacyl-[acyl-carrier protein] reductase